jgi:phytoene desaturase (3,4-didehydrolycopene-forming)
VGGGVGGLAVAARIAAASPSESCQVTILEKNDQLGGRCGSVDIHIPGINGTFRHDRGPSLFLLPEVYQELFQACHDDDDASSTSEDYGLRIRPCQPAYQVVFDDGDRIELGFPKQLPQQQKQATSTLLMEKANFSRQKMDSYEPNGARKWDDYMRAMSAFLDCGLPNFIEERLDLTTFPAFLTEALRDFGKVSQDCINSSCL